MLQKGNGVFILDIDEAELKHCCEVHLKEYYDNQRLGYSICDLRDTDDIKNQVKKAAEFLGGRVDVLINNGGWFLSVLKRILLCLLLS